MENNNNSNEPVILGTLRKEKVSRPLFVFLLFGVLISVVVFLPYINDYTKKTDNNPQINNDEAPKKEIKYPLLNEKTTLKKDNIEITNILLEGNNIKYDLINKGNEVLDNNNLYLYVYDEDEKLIKEIKLTGMNKEKTTHIESFNNQNKLVYGEIKEFNNYPNVDIKTLNCQKENDTYEYNFTDNKLKEIKHTHKYLKNESDYFNNLRDNLSNNITILEDGFSLLKSINLSEEKEYINDHYYKLDTLSNKINYDMKLKGYACV